MQMKGDPMPEGTFAMRDIILKMIHTGKYSPGSDWLTPSFGKGLCIDKAFCAFKMCTKPSLTNKNDVDLVFFDDGRRLTPQTFWDFVATTHARDCIARGGPCETQQGWEHFMSHFDVNSMDQTWVPMWMRTPSQKSARTSL